MNSKIYAFAMIEHKLYSKLKSLICLYLAISKPKHPKCKKRVAKNWKDVKSKCAAKAPVLIGLIKVSWWPYCI